MILTIWGQTAGTALHTVHLASAVGYIVAPKVASIFLDEETSGKGDRLSARTTSCYRNNQNASTVEGKASIDSSVTEARYPADFVYSLWIFAAAGICVSIAFVGYFIHKKMLRVHYNAEFKTNRQTRYRIASSIVSNMSPRTCSSKKPVLALLLLLVAILNFSMLVPLIDIFPKMIFSYARDEACLSVDQQQTSSRYSSSRLQQADWGLWCCLHPYR